MSDLDSVVEDLMTYVPLNPGAAREATAEAVITDQPGPHPYFSNVGRVRTDDVPGLVARARAFFAERGREQFVWFLGPSAQPAGLVEQLLGHGAEHADVGTALVLTEAPPPGPDVDIRLVTGVEGMRDWETVSEVERAFHAPGTPAPPSRAEELWELQRADPRRRTYVAYVDGRPVSAAGLIVTDHGFCILSGGATIPEARGRGTYTALVAHRWREAVAAGVPVLAVHASTMSQPILSGLGFRSVAPLTILRQRV